MPAQVAPDVLTYTTLADAFAKSQPPRALEAERVLDEAGSGLYDAQLFTTVIDAYARVLPPVPEEAERMLRRSEDAGVARPSLIPFLCTHFTRAGIE